MSEDHLTLPSGRQVTVLSRTVIEQAGMSGGSLGIQYRSAIPENDVMAQRAEAAEVIAHFRSEAEEHGYSMSAQVCNTEKAAQMREPPQRTFGFTRGAHGAWEYRSTLGPDGQPEP